MVALSPYYDKVMIYSLDRIHHLEMHNETFKMPTDWDAEVFFYGCYGIIADHRIAIQPVKIKVSAGQANYIRDLQLHESQKEIERNEEYSVFSYNIRPTFDFIQEILRNGEDMEVIAPKELREEVAGIDKRMNKKY